MIWDAAILDVDGVLTRTAAQHERAWKRMFDAELASRGDPRPFTHDEYLLHVDGRPRLDGARALFAARGIALAEDELRAVAVRKNDLYLQLVAEEGVQVFPDAIETVRAWRRHGVGIAFVSASRNARRILATAGLLPLADVCIDGETAAAEGLHGKLDLFRAAARRLDAEPARTFVVEDAVAGVEAAAAGGFGLVVGLARTGEAAVLAAHGATRVEPRLDALVDLVERGTRPGIALPAALAAPADEAPVPADAPAPGELPGLAEALLAWVDAEAPVVVLDFDGTLAPIVDHPDAAALPDDTRAALLALAARCPVVVVSERDRADVTRRVGLPSLGYVGRDDLDLGWDTGRALVHALAGLPPGSVPLYVGDGRTDEDAFRAVRAVPGGLGVRVGAPRRPTFATLRVRDPAEVGVLLRALTAALDVAGAGPAATEWTLRWTSWSPEQEPLREALCTLGNGCFATRGAAEESRADGVHYPGTYLAGGYDRLTTEIRGEVLENEDLVNWPNWLPLTFRSDDTSPGEWFALERVTVLAFSQELDLRRGVLRRAVRFRDTDGRTSRLASERFVSMDDPHVAALRWTLVAEDWSGPVRVRASLDGTVVNAGVARYRALRGEHLVPEGTGPLDAETVWLRARTRQSRIRMAVVARTRVSGDAVGAGVPDLHIDRTDQTFACTLARERPLVVEKVVAIHTSRDVAIADPLESARVRMLDLPPYDALRARHVGAWARLHRRLDIHLEGPPDTPGPSDTPDGLAEANRILRLHTFHLIQVASPHIVDRDVGIPARGLHGEAYRGHVFWDELFVFPYLNQRFPELTRELLLYRHRRLDAARRIAGALGHRGACFPWQSGSDGREETQVLHQNPRSGRWVPDDTDRQRHVGAAVAWNVWQYVETTGDLAFLADHGAELLVEIAQFWASLATWDAALGRFRIRGVTGPDEFHTGYPPAFGERAAHPGLDDNAYTNVMAAWCLRIAARALDAVGAARRQELLDRLQVVPADLERWEAVRRALRVCFDGHVISAFDGYPGLLELDWDHYRKRYGDIQRLDRILEAEGDTPNRYKASKQADVLMLFFLFGDDELVTLLGSMGYRFDPAWIPENIDYYLRRTSHGSTLSRVLHSWVLARHDRPRSWRLFLEALRADVADVQGGTTAEGIHLGAMAGTIDLVHRGYTGATLHDGVLWLAPRLPDELCALRTRFEVHGARLEVRLTHTAVEVAFVSGIGASTARVGVDGHIHTLALGQRRRFVRGAPA